MAIFMKGIGLMIKQMDLEFIFIVMVLDMRVIGSMIYKKEKVNIISVQNFG